MGLWSLTAVYLGCRVSSAVVKEVSSGLFNGYKIMSLGLGFMIQGYVDQSFENGATGLRVDDSGVC